MGNKDDQHRNPNTNNKDHLVGQLTKSGPEHMANHQHHTGLLTRPCHLPAHHFYELFKWLFITRITSNLQSKCFPLQMMQERTQCPTCNPAQWRPSAFQRGRGSHDWQMQPPEPHDPLINGFPLCLPPPWPPYPELLQWQRPPGSFHSRAKSPTKQLLYLLPAHTVPASWPTDQLFSKMHTFCPNNN